MIVWSPRNSFRSTSCRCRKWNKRENKKRRTHTRDMDHSTAPAWTVKRQRHVCTCDVSKCVVFYTVCPSQNTSWILVYCVFTSVGGSLLFGKFFERRIHRNMETFYFCFVTKHMWQRKLSGIFNETRPQPGPERTPSEQNKVSGRLVWTKCCSLLTEY